MKAGDKVRIVGPMLYVFTDSTQASQFNNVYYVQEIDSKRGEEIKVNGYWYYAESLQSVPDDTSMTPAPPPIAATPPSAPTPATRYNKHKPELSYLLDFPVALPMLMGSRVPLKSPEFDFTYELINLTPVYAANIIRYEILPRLQAVICAPTAAVTFDINTIDKLLWVYSEAFDDFARACANGTISYSRYNWKKGYPITTLKDCALRHYRKYCAGIERDTIDDAMLERWETDDELRDMFDGDVEAFERNFETYHLSHVMWNLMVYIEQTATSATATVAPVVTVADGGES